MKESVLLFLAIFLLSSITAQASKCNRSCDDKFVPYPFGFSAGCQIPLNCSSSGQKLIAGFPILTIDSDRIKISIESTCNRPLQALHRLYGPNYAPTSRNAILLQNCSSPAPCIIPSSTVYTNFGALACSPNSSNISCYSENNINGFVDYNEVVRTNCKSFLSSISAGSFNESGVLGVQVVELGWWLEGRCSEFCSANAICDEIVSPFNGEPGFRCRCKDGFMGDGYRAGHGCRKGEGNNTARTVIIVIASVVSFLILITVSICIFSRQRKTFKKVETVETEVEISGVESLQFDFATILDAANNFSDKNKLGQGGFGVVYKGRLLNGQEIAVKRLSWNSEQGELEFKNEVLLMAKLQHRNLVRLLGYCLRGQERLLIYEFVPNASLYHFICDPNKRAQLDWEKRYKIIAGIARGLVYLHEDSRLRIIHRDLKASNVLLDTEMIPKIADFGTARLFGQDETEASTSRIVGTRGYMAPEYVNHGHFSVKSDVFSFGVLLLEIISGQLINRFRHEETDEFLINFAWRNWREGTSLNLIDPTLSDGSRDEMMRCIQIGLLCVQENVAGRPTMASVVFMLNSCSTALPVPSQPGFSPQSNNFVSNMSSSLGTSSLASGSNQSKNETLPLSQNEATITELSPR